MKILISGHNGFISGHLINFLKIEHEVFTISRKKNKDNSILNNYAIDLSNVKLVKEKFTESFINEKIDVIIHCAAVITAKNNKDISIFHENNSITESMIYIAETLNPNKFINLSTIGVYPNKSGVYNENSVIGPSSNHECLYSLSKFCGEELFEFYLKNKMQVINLRLAQVFGTGMRQDRIFSIMKDELKRKNTITVFGNGERTSNFISIKYLINKINVVIENIKAKGIFNVGQYNISYTELAEMIIKENGDDLSKIILNKNGVKSKVIIDSSKIDKL